LSFAGSLLVPILVAVLTLSGGWLITTRVADHWDRVKKRRELDLAAAQEFQSLYGEIIATWKTWNALNGGYTAQFPVDPREKWACLERATAAEGRIEALISKVAAERDLSPADIAVLGGIRQSFKQLRRLIRSDSAVQWRSDKTREYAALKGWAAATSVLLATSDRKRDRPSPAVAAYNFREITRNDHETTWRDLPDYLTTDPRLLRAPRRGIRRNGQSAQ
jgi:hypothetical protein